jgi:hypothetical protein
MKRKMASRRALKFGGTWRRVTARMRLLIFLPLLVLANVALAGLPMEVCFKGKSKFDELVSKADQWKSLPIGERVAAVGRAMVGTPYKSYTLEIDDHVEAPSVNLTGVDCWTFFETSLAFARMLNEPREKWTPQTMLHYIELDRYRGGACNGSYLSRLHYLEDWLRDNNRRGLVSDMTRQLGGVKASRQSAIEMTVNWRSYRYLRNDPSLRSGIRNMEESVAKMGLWYVPKEKVNSIEGSLKTGDVIGIATHDGGKIGTSHVGLAVRLPDGIHFMHASAPRNYGKVVLDSRLTDYLYRYRSDAGILVGRPLK